MRSSLILSGVILLLLASCAPVTSFEDFVFSRDAVGGVYHFTLDLSDSTAVYDLYFYTAQECGSIELRPLWTGPSGETFSETVCMQGRQKELYRSGFSMKNPGLWKLDVSVFSEPEDFRGLGVVCQER